MAKSLLRKKCSRKTGLKILVYGENNVGKSIYALTFPEVCVVDSESKIGVYEDSKYGDNIVAIADTAKYFEMIDIMKEVMGGKTCKTLVIDSETNIYQSMTVSCLEVEEKRAIKKGQDILDTNVSLRGYGRLKLDYMRFNELKAQASANGVNLISVCHQENIMQKVGSENVVVGVRPDIRKKSEHSYDVILRFFKDKDLVTGKYKYKAEIVKDTSLTFENGTIIENPTYENTFKSYIEKGEKLSTIKTSYSETISSNMDTLSDEAQSFEDLSGEFATLFKALKDKDKANGVKIKELLNSKGVKSYNKPEYFEQLKEVVEELRKW